MIVREIFGHAHFCEGHAHIVAANETNSPRCQWNPTFSSYKQVFSYILCQIKVHWLKGGWQSWLLSQASKLVQDIQAWKGGGHLPPMTPPPWIRPCSARDLATVIDKNFGLANLRVEFSQIASSLRGGREYY